MKIHIVEGHTGEYSDHRDWPIAAYYSEEKAKQHVVLATEAANELYSKHDDYGDIDDSDEKNPYDPDMKTDYTGTRYNYYSVEIKDSI